LRSKLYTVSEVSEKSGFCDVKYFSKTFKKHYGVSPGKFMNILPEKEWK
jgi:AraC-like DNA-binding protein